MLKKLCLILVAIVMLTGSALADDSRIAVQVIIHQKDNESALTAEMLIRDDEILLTSGLFPSYAFSVTDNHPALSETSAAMKEFNPFDLSKIAPFLTGMIQNLNPETAEGVFSGDLFDNASSVMKGRFILNSLMNILTGEDENKLLPGSAVTEIASELFSISDLSNIEIQYNLYDEGNYLILNGLENDQTFFTISFNFTDPSAVKALLGYADEGANYYWKSEVSILSENDLNYSSVLIADPQKKGYRSIMQNKPILTENWNVKLSESRKILSFTGEILPANDKKPVDVSGSVSLEDQPEMLAEIRFRDWEEAYLTISVKSDKSSMNTEGLKIFNMNSLTDDTETEAFKNEIVENAVPLFMKIMLVLPDEYRKDLLPLN